MLYTQSIWQIVNAKIRLYILASVFQCSKEFALSFNFLSKFNILQRKRFAKITIGKKLRKIFLWIPTFEKMKHRKRKLVQQIQSEFKEIMKWKAKPMNKKVKLTMIVVSVLQNKLQRCSITFLKQQKKKNKNENKEFNIVLIKFMKIFESFSQNRKVSAFSKFRYHIFR